MTTWTPGRWFGIAAVLLAGCGRPPVDAPTSSGEMACAAPVMAWARRCAAREGLAIPEVDCPEDRMALVSLGGNPGIRVELRPADARSFRRAGAWGLSPIGDFPDWGRVDARVRDHFDKLQACVRADESFAQGLTASARRARALAPLNALTLGGSVPWLLLGALACALLALRGARPAAWRARLGLGAGLAAATFALRAAAFPARFFHQNGQGPLWVSTLVSPHPHPYGPGFRSLFGCLRWLARDPDRGVFFLQGALASLSVPCAAFVARRLGAKAPLAYALALVVAVDPILGRLSRSESYYGVGASLLFVAAALLASSLAALRLRGAGFLLPVLAAALVIAQHALVHPVGWLAAALSPAVMLLGPGGWRRRARRTAAASLIIAAVVAVLAVPAMLAVLRSPFGAQWMSGSDGAHGFAGVALVRRFLPALAAGALLAAACARFSRRGALVALVALAALLALLTADLVGFGLSTPWIHQAYLRLYAPTAVVLAAAALAGVRSRALAAGVALLGVAASAAMWAAWTRLPTDAQEQELARRWRAEIPATARVAYLERLGRRVVVLPFYRGAPHIGAEPIVLRPGERSEDLLRPGHETFYERTSLCSAPEGVDFCARFEGRYRLATVHELELPAVPSMVGLGYGRAAVRVGLYRVLGEREAPGGVATAAGPSSAGRGPARWP